MKGLKIVRTKIEFLNCNFSRDVQRVKMLVRIEAQEIPQRVHFDILA